jgi:hypothetical protein
LSFRPPREPDAPYQTRSQRHAANRKRQRQMADKRDNRYGRPQAIGVRAAADVGLPSRNSLPADVVRTR